MNNIQIILNNKMCDENMTTTNYIYLLQTREFIKVKENIFKIGMTSKLNHTRFNQYPKGSTLLFQIICNNCKNMEKLILKKFREEFKLRKDIGNEYFEGDYKTMIDIIYSIVKQEDANHAPEANDIEDEKDEKYERDESDEDEEEYADADEFDIDTTTVEKIKEYKEEVYQITTYEEWVKYTDISKIVISNKKKGEGYLRFKNQMWRKLDDKTRLDWDDNMEHLLEYIKLNQPSVKKMIAPRNELILGYERLILIHSYKNKVTGEIINYNTYYQLEQEEKNKWAYIKNETYKFVDTNYDVDKIYQDTIDKCYVKECEFYELAYHEYMISSINLGGVQYFGLNLLNFTFTSVNELINDKVLHENCIGQRRLYMKSDVNISMVDDILNSLINTEIKASYKKLMYNLLVKPEEKQIIFYDYNECLLSTWLSDLLYSIAGYRLHIHSHDYYDDKVGFKRFLKTKKIRCVIISNNSSKVSIKTQIEDFCKLGFKYIIVCQDDRKKVMYNVINFKKYLQDNKEKLINYISQEYKYEIKDFDDEIRYNNNIFYNQRLLLTNFLKWCCVKNDYSY